MLEIIFCLALSTLRYKISLWYAMVILRKDRLTGQALVAFGAIGSCLSRKNSSGFASQFYFLSGLKSLSAAFYIKVTLPVMFINHDIIFRVGGETNLHNFFNDIHF